MFLLEPSSGKHHSFLPWDCTDVGGVVPGDVVPYSLCPTAVVASSRHEPLHQMKGLGPPPAILYLVVLSFMVEVGPENGIVLECKIVEHYPTHHDPPHDTYILLQSSTKYAPAHL